MESEQRQEEGMQRRFIFIRVEFFFVSCFVIHFLAPCGWRRCAIFVITEVRVDVSVVTVFCLLCFVFIVINVGVASEREIRTER
jgi:hypothetical protein